MGNVSTNDMEFKGESNILFNCYKILDTLRRGEIEINIFFHFQKLIEKWYAQKSEIQRKSVTKRTSDLRKGNKLVEDNQLNEDLLSWTLGEIDTVSRSVQYDIRRRMSYFQIVVDKLKTTKDLFTKVQKYIHMIELYHINLYSNLADVEDSQESGGSDKINQDDPVKIRSITGVIEEHKGYTIRELIEGNIDKNLVG